MVKNQLECQKMQTCNHYRMQTQTKTVSHHNKESYCFGFVQLFIFYHKATTFLIYVIFNNKKTSKPYFVM